MKVGFFLHMPFPSSGALLRRDGLMVGPAGLGISIEWQLKECACAWQLGRLYGCMSIRMFFRQWLRRWVGGWLFEDAFGRINLLLYWERCIASCIYMGF